MQGKAAFPSGVLDVTHMKMSREGLWSLSWPLRKGGLTGAFKALPYLHSFNPSPKKSLRLYCVVLARTSLAVPVVVQQSELMHRNPLLQRLSCSLRPTPPATEHTGTL